MEIYDLVEIYSSIVKGNYKNSLDVIQAAEDQGVKSMVEALVATNHSKEQIIAALGKKSKGRKPVVIKNPLYELANFGEEDDHGLTDAIHGVCNSFDEGDSAKRIKITPRKLRLVLKMDEITTDKVMGMLFVGKAQAGRYIRAAKILIEVLGKQQ